MTYDDLRWKATPVVGMDWIECNTILKVIWGSQAFGTAGPDSDVDVRGVCIPPARFLVGLSRFEQDEDRAAETVIYSLAKFVELALANNPNMLDILWAEDEHVLYCDEYGAALRAVRAQFLSRKVARTYAGYAEDQLKRMETHYRWLHDPPDHQPAPGEFGAVRDAKGGVRFPDTQKERAYHSALKHWQNYGHWRANRNPDRAAREAHHGYDTKHAAHLLRLYRMGIEILREGVLRVRRPDAGWLREVLGGRYTYPELMDLVAGLRAELIAAEAESTLPASPDAEAIEGLVVQLHLRALADGRFQGGEGVNLQHDKIEQALALYREGAGSPGYIAEQLGLPKQELIRAARQQGLEPDWSEDSFADDLG